MTVRFSRAFGVGWRQSSPLSMGRPAQLATSAISSSSSRVSASMLPLASVRRLAGQSASASPWLTLLLKARSIVPWPLKVKMPLIEPSAILADKRWTAFRMLFLSA